MIANPGQELHARFLATGETGSAGVNINQTELLDKQALKEYRQRLAELKDEKIEASQSGDDGLYQELELEQEQDALNDALSQALGLSGRQRVFSSDDERARKSISARIRSSIERIGAVHSALAEHFNQSIRTGQFCSYNAPSDLHWQTQG